MRDLASLAATRETGLLLLVALGFGLGFGVAAWATAPLVEPEPAPASRSSVVPGAPSATAPASGEAADPPEREATPAGREAESASDPSEVGPGPRLGPLVAELREKHLTLPVEGVERDALYDSFDDPRSGGRTHEAIDIMAPRGTPVFAVEDGTIARLDDSQGGGGIVIYQYDPDRRFVYYYAHLETWVEGLEEGDRVGRGQVIGYVGTTGNAPPDAPHLHFAITVLDERGRWWGGTPIDPFGLF